MKAGKECNGCWNTLSGVWCGALMGLSLRLCFLHLLVYVYRMGGRLLRVRRTILWLCFMGLGWCAQAAIGMSSMYVCRDPMEFAR